MILFHPTSPRKPIQPETQKKYQFDRRSLVEKPPENLVDNLRKCSFTLCKLGMKCRLATFQFLIFGARQSKKLFKKIIVKTSVKLALNVVLQIYSLFNTCCLRFMARKGDKVSRGQLQLVGVSAMFLASKVSLFWFSHLILFDSTVLLFS